MLKAKIVCSQGTCFYDFDETEDALWKYVGQIMKYIPCPDNILVYVGTRQATISKVMNQYGRPQYSITSNIEGLVPAKYDWKRLQLVDPVHNGYYRYELIPHNMGTRTISFSENYGRYGASKTDIGAEKISRFQQSPELFWIKYYDLLSMGFEDLTDSFSQNVMKAPSLTDAMQETSTKTKEISDEEYKNLSVGDQLFLELQESAKDAVKLAFDVDLLKQTSPFSKKQIDACRDVWNSLGKSKSVSSFNKKICKLLALSPRKIDPYQGMTVKSYLATEDDNPAKQAEIYARIIDREDALIKAMEAITDMDDGNTPVKPISQGIGAFKGKTIRMSTEDERKEVLDMFHADNSSKRLASMVNRIWRIEPIDQRKKFNEYCKHNNIDVTKLLFHGSSTENWCSIIDSKLLLNPNAVISGKAYGLGIYFALSADKSFGYTSFHNSRWANGSSNTAFMGVYETAYGKPADPSEFDYHGSSIECVENLREIGKNCLHARAGQGMGFCRDEIIFYDENAVCMKYLIEFVENNDSSDESV